MAAAAAAVAGAAAVAAVPSAGEPTVYVPPPRDHAIRSATPPAAAGRQPAPARTRASPGGSGCWLCWRCSCSGLIGFLGAQVFGGLGPGRQPIADAGAAHAARLGRRPDRRRPRRRRAAWAWCSTSDRGAIARTFARRPGHPHRPGGGTPVERGRHDHGRRQRGRRHRGGAEPDRPDQRARPPPRSTRPGCSWARSTEEPRTGRQATVIRSDPRGRARRRARLAGGPGPVDRADAIPDTAAHAAADAATDAGAHRHADSGAHVNGADIHVAGRC